MIRLILIFPPRLADDFVRIPWIELHQLPPSVPFDECHTPQKEPA